MPGPYWQGFGAITVNVAPVTAVTTALALNVFSPGGIANATAATVIGVSQH